MHRCFAAAAPPREPRRRFVRSVSWNLRIICQRRQANGSAKESGKKTARRSRENDGARIARTRPRQNFRQGQVSSNSRPKNRYAHQADRHIYFVEREYNTVGKQKMGAPVGNSAGWIFSIPSHPSGVAVWHRQIKRRPAPPVFAT